MSKSTELGPVKARRRKSPLKEELERIKAISNSLLDPELAIRIFEADWDAKIIVDQDGLMQVVNARAEFLSGYMRHELYGQHINMLLPERARAAHTAHIERYLLNPRVGPMMLHGNQDLVMLHKAGHELQIVTYLVPVQWLDGIIVCATIRRMDEHGK